MPRMAPQHPYLDDASPALRFWANKYKTRFNEDPTVTSVYGYMVMDLFVKGAEKAGPELTTDSFVKAMDRLTVAPDMFGTDALSFSATKRLGSDATRLSQLQDGRWKVVSDYARPRAERRESILLALQILVGGIAQGCIYGLIALGFVLIYKATETVSFAQGELMMLGAFAGFALDHRVRAALLGGAAGGGGRDGRLRHRRRARGDPPGARPARLLDRDAHHRPGLHGARRDHDGAVRRHRHAPARGALQGRSPALGGMTLAAEHLVVIGATAAAVPAALPRVQPQPDRHRHAGELAEPARRLLHGHSGASASTAWSGAWPRRWRRSPGCCSRPSPSCTPTWASSG